MEVDLLDLLQQSAEGRAPSPPVCLAAVAAGLLWVSPRGSEMVLDGHVGAVAVTSVALRHRCGFLLGRKAESSWWQSGDRAAATDVRLGERLGAWARLLAADDVTRAWMLGDAEETHAAARLGRRRAWSAEMVAATPGLVGALDLRSAEGSLRSQRLARSAVAAHAAALAQLYPELPAEDLARAASVVVGVPLGWYAAPEDLSSLDAVVRSLDRVPAESRPRALSSMISQARSQASRAVARR